MLGNEDMYPVIAVSDLDAAKQFYVGTLGLEIENEDAATRTAILKTGNGKLLLYVSDYVGTNKATAAVWIVDDVSDTVETLESKGVEFEEYEDMEGVVIKDHVHILGETEAVWFKDPDGNILCAGNTI